MVSREKKHAAAIAGTMMNTSAVVKTYNESPNSRPPRNGPRTAATDLVAQAK
jgi:hypothetical protein